MVKTFVSLVLHSRASVLQHVLFQLDADHFDRDPYDFDHPCQHRRGFSTDLQESVLPNDTVEPAKLNRRGQQELKRRERRIRQKMQRQGGSWWWLPAGRKCWQEKQKDSATRKQKRSAEHSPPHPQLHSKEGKIATDPSQANGRTSIISTPPISKRFKQLGRAIHQHEGPKLSFKKNFKTAAFHSILLSILSIPFNSKILHE